MYKPDKKGILAQRKIFIDDIEYYNCIMFSGTLKLIQTAIRDGNTFYSKVHIVLG